MQNVEVGPATTTRAPWLTLRISRSVRLLLRPPWLIFLVSLVVTTLPLPWVIGNWVPQGDEPHYLLAAHSLVTDGDLDLGNNYAQGDYLRFYPDPIDPHVRTGADGRRYLLHDVGLPILIAPAYALAGRAGVMVFLAIVAALVATNVYGLAYDVSADRMAAALTWLVFSLAPLLSVYAYLVYPEMIGALIVIWCVRQHLSRTLVPAAETLVLRHDEVAGYQNRNAGVGARSARLGPWRGLLTGAETAVALCFLPWLSARFIPIGLFLALWGAWRTRADRRRWLVWLGLPALSLIGYFAVSAWLNGGGSGAVDFNSGPIAHGFQDLAVERLLRGLAGWWLDQQRGVLIYAPVYVVAFIGLPLLWRRWRWLGLALLMPVLIAYGSAVAWGGFWIGWEVSARYLVIGLPLLAAPMALAWSMLRGRLFRATAVGLLVVSVLNTVLVLSAPGIAAYRESLVWIVDGRTPIDLWRGLPAMGTGGRVDPDPDAISAATVVADGGRAAWHTPAGQSGVVIQSSALKDLTAGWYVLNFDARALSVPSPEAPLLSIDVFSGEGIFLLHHILNGSDFPADGTYRSVGVSFQSPFYNKWSYPVYAQVSTSGLAETWVTALTLSSDPGPTWGVTGVWVGLIGLAVIGFNRQTRRRRDGD